MIDLKRTDQEKYGMFFHWSTSMVRSNQIIFLGGPTFTVTWSESSKSEFSPITNIGA